jgi:hypothetical protein
MDSVVLTLTTRIRMESPYSGVVLRPDGAGPSWG